MLFNLTPEQIIINLIVLGVAMTVHEFAHNYVGYMMGDPVPQKEGRLTLNPLVHINPIGWLMFAFIGFGILGSAPISPYRMRNPRWGYLTAVAAGPLSNLALAIVFGIIIRVLGVETLIGLPSFITSLLTSMVLLNVLLFIFNILPLFPLDGWYIVLSILPAEPAYTWDKYRQQSYYVFIGLILISLAQSFAGLSFIPNFLQILISEPTIAISRFLIGF